MKQLIIAIIMATAILCACKAREKKYSKSYSYIKGFLMEAAIIDDNLMYFYKGRPRSGFPNVYCFDSKGVELMSPPQCYQVIQDYVRLLNDTIVPPKPGGWQLHDFLDSTVVIDVYNDNIDRSALKGYDYYIFIDYIAIPLPGLKEALQQAYKSTITSKKKIRLFLVHAISEYNLRYFGKKTGSDTTTRKETQ
jgi:hypothetical protein